MELADFHSEFFQEIAASAGADGRFKELLFFEKLKSWVEGNGDIETADYVAWSTMKQDARVDGYGGDPLESDGVLTLIICDFVQSPEVSVLHMKELLSNFDKLVQFLKRCLEPAFRHGLEESNPVFGLADLVAARWSKVSKVQLMLFTNRELRTRIDSMKGGTYENVEVTYNVWDISRLHKLAMSGRAQEDRDIDLVKDFGGAIPALPAHLDNGSYEAFLMVVPGRQLAAIYDRWGPRLLEQNVRSFLQARGGVNKGIRRTIDKDPDMFFAYNNGITATAEDVETEEVDGAVRIISIKNLQIVNGGQTTGSVHSASRSKTTDLSRVFIQMKLSIVKPDQAEQIVPKISEYANSQNKVNAADFFANHPFHIEIEKLSRSVHAPSLDGGFVQTRWFYERARGQYIDARTRLAESARRKFDIEFPKNQLVTKTDLAKVLNLWLGKPHVVARGAQKNFSEFAGQIGETWEARKDDYNDAFFKESIAKTIIFLATEKIVSDQPWYSGGGSRAPIVAYAIAKIAHDVGKRGDALNFELVWRMQSVPSALRNALVVASKSANDVITSPTSPGQTITEWAKQSACWKRMQETEISWSDDFDAALIMKSDAADNRKAARSDKRLISGIQAQIAAVKAGATFWGEVLKWSKLKNYRVTPSDMGILQVLATPGKMASDKQCARAVELLAAMNNEGCELLLPT